MNRHIFGGKVTDRQTDMRACGAGWVVSQGARRRGFLEDLRLWCELSITQAFDVLRWLVRKLLLMPVKDPTTRPTIELPELVRMPHPHAAALQRPKDWMVSIKEIMSCVAAWRQSCDVALSFFTKLFGFLVVALW
jgi:hypothetical protein